jgi:hypothetical protein
MEPRIKTQEEINRTKYRSPAYPCPSPEGKPPTTPPTTKPPAKPPEEKAIEKSLRAIEETLRGVLRTQGDIIYLLQELVRASETELVDLKLDSGLQNLPNPVTIVPAPDDINPLTGYTRIIVYDILNRTSPELYFLNQGPGTIFIRMSKNGKAFSESESVIFEGEVKTFYDVYELRVRTTTANTNYIVTEFAYLKQRDIVFLSSRPFVLESNIPLTLVSPYDVLVVTDPTQGLGRNAHTGYIINDGPNNLQVRLSNDGVTFAPPITIIPNQILDLDGEDMYTIRLSVAVGNASFRLAVH